MGRPDKETLVYEGLMKNKKMFPSVIGIFSTVAHLPEQMNCVQRPPLGP